MSVSIPLPRTPRIAAPPRRALPPAALGGLAVAAMFGAWWAVTASGRIPADLLPGPGAVLAAFLDIARHGYRGTSLGENIAATLARCMAGFGLAVVLGVPLGLWMGLRQAPRAAANWVVQFMRPLPPLSYMILLILWLGTGNASKAALLFLTAFPIIASAAMAGVRQVKTNRIQAAQALGATDAQVLRFVVLPSAAPMIFTGLSIALAAAFSTVVSAELIASTDGLGWMVIAASRFLRTDIVILAILILGLIGVALAAALRAVDRRVVHWRGRD
jgi:taurine transport system permease protein